MENTFKLHLEKNFPLLHKKKIVVALSGGVDSITLAYLFKKLNFNIIACHCNFSLRDKESYQDELFVKDWTSQMNIPVEIKTFSTKQYARENKINIQLAARKLRYNWFEEIRKKHNADFIATAHHLDDSIETFIINLSRGTGIQGLTGIPKENNTTIRPLLPFCKQEIVRYAEKEKLPWREDSSNASDKYLRNKIRHYILNPLKQLHPNFPSNFNKTIEYLKQTEKFCHEQSEKLKSEYFKPFENGYLIDIEKLKTEKSLPLLLHQWFSPFGIHNIKDLTQLISSETGKELTSKSHRLIKSQNQWILTPIKPKKYNQKQIFFIEKYQKITDEPFKISIEKVEKIETINKNTIYVDEDKLNFPLQIRTYEKNDYFSPFGMKGKKKVSKFLKDEKLSVLEKENQWVLTSNNQIVWIVSLRADNRFSINQSTKNILKISIIK